MTCATTLRYEQSASDPSETPAEAKGTARPAETTTVSEYDDAGPFAIHFKKLREIARGKVTDRDDIEPASYSSVWWAERILEILRELDAVPDRVVASAEGGIAICFVRAEKYCDIECLNTGEILGVTSNRKD